MIPERIQLSRARGWRMPPDTIKVDRSTVFGNPFTLSKAKEAGYKGSDAELVAMNVNAFWEWLTYPRTQCWWQGSDSETARQAILTGLDRLRGKNLACWCKPGTPCHADILLKMANRDVAP